MYKEAEAMKTASQAHHTTAAIWFRFAAPKFLLHCVTQKLHIAAERCATCKKPTAHSGTFGFADTQSQRKKPKEPEFLPTLDRKLIN